MKVTRVRGLLLLYAPDERIVLPDGMDDWRFLLVHGEAADSHEYGLDEADPRRPSLPAWSLGPDALVRRVVPAWLPRSRDKGYRNDQNCSSSQSITR